MPITIGEKTLATTRPANLDAQLLEVTGCSATEAQTWLRGTPLPGFVARALRPFLADEDAPSHAELSSMIADAGPAAIAGQVAALYVAAPVDQPVAAVEAQGNVA